MKLKNQKNSVMVIGISLNGVLRNFLEKVRDTHEKYFPTETELVVGDYELDKWLTFPEEEIDGNEIEFDINFSEDEVELVGSNDEVVDIKLNKIKKTTTLDEFLYEKCTLEIFGSANEVQPNSIDYVNKLLLQIKEKYNDVTLCLMSREMGLSVPSTLFFLSKTSSMCPNIIFVTEYSKHWDEVDVMITDQPEIITSKPNGKVCIKVEYDYNKELSSDFTIKSIKEFDLDLIDKIKTLQIN